MIRIFLKQVIAMAVPVTVFLLSSIANPMIGRSADTGLPIAIQAFAADLSAAQADSPSVTQPDIGLSDTTPDGRMIAAGVHYAFAEFRSVVGVWDTKTGDHLRELSVKNNYEYVVAFAPDSKTLAVASRSLSNSRIDVLDTQSWKAVLTIDLPRVNISALVFSPDDNTLAVGEKKNRSRPINGSYKSTPSGCGQRR